METFNIEGITPVRKAVRRVYPSDLIRYKGELVEVINGDYGKHSVVFAVRTYDGVTRYAAYGATTRLRVW